MDLRTGTEAVVERLRLFAAPYDPENLAYKGDKVDEVVTSTFADVVHAAPADGKCRDDKSQID